MSSFTERHGRFEVVTGCPVFTSDGEQLGDVKEVSGDYFKVDAPMARDYWLSCDYISTSSDNRLVLGITKDNIGDYKLNEPGADQPAPYDSEAEVREPVIGGTSDALISEEEQREQRERMERELAEQRRDLPHS